MMMNGLGYCKGYEEEDMYCYKCGTQLSDEAKFCHKCGTRIDGVCESQDLTNANAVSSITNGNATVDLKSVSPGINEQDNNIDKDKKTNNNKIIMIVVAIIMVFIGFKACGTMQNVEKTKSDTYNSYENSEDLTIDENDNSTPFTGVIGIMFLALVIFNLVVYHKIFAVYYFNFSRAIQKELIGAIFVAAIEVGIIMYLWWLAVLIILGVGVSIRGKVNDPMLKNGVTIACVIFAIIIAIVGINAKASAKELSAWNNNSSCVMQQA